MNSGLAKLLKLFGDNFTFTENLERVSKCFFPFQKYLIKIFYFKMLLVWLYLKGLYMCLYHDLNLVYNAVGRKLFLFPSLSQTSQVLT